MTDRAATTDTLMRADDLAVSIAGKPICRGLDWRLRRGERWAVLGGNGAGKTTLLLVLAGLRAADAGSLALEGRPVSGLSRRQIARRIGLLFQDNADPFPATVLETALIGRHPHLAAWEWESDADYRLARETLADVDLAGLEPRQVGTLSGGERRRLAIATLLVQQPDVYLLDEPTNHLDLHHQIQLLERVLAHCRDRDGALCMVLHDVNLAARFATHALLVHGTGEVDQGPIDSMLQPRNLARLYGHPIELVEQGGRRAFLPG